MCIQISFSSAVAKNAFGAPCVRLSQIPKHAVYAYYTIINNEPCWHVGYAITGYATSTTKELGQVHTPAGWGDKPYAHFYNGPYLIMGHDALRNAHSTDFEKAENLVFMGNIKYADGDYDAALELYNKALDAQFYNMDAWVGIFNVYKAKNSTDAEFYELAKRMAEHEKMIWYPLAISDYLLTLITPEVESKPMRADIAMLVNEAMNRSTGVYPNNSTLAQPSLCREFAAIIRDRIPKLAGFSLDTGEITINSTYRGTQDTFMYSFDNGATWTEKKYADGVFSYKLTDEELASITDANDILCKFKSSEKSYRIAIGTAKAPVSNAKTNTPDDNEDRFLNIQRGLEWSEDEGATWHNLDATSTFEGDIKIWLRTKASGTNLASPHIVITFTQGEGTPQKSYIKLSGNITVISAPANFSTNKPAYAFDGNLNTMWINAWANAGHSMVRDPETEEWSPNHNYEFVLMFKQPYFISALSYVPGDADGAIRGMEVYTSGDGNSWQLAGKVENWTPDITEKSLDFDKPAYAKYIKLRTTQVGTKQHPSTHQAGYVTAKEFKFYENYECPKKDVKELTLTADDAKTSYKVGDKLDMNGVTARVIYADKSSALIPVSELEYDKEIFDSTDITSVTASYKGAAAEFKVKVAPNDRTATEIKSVTPADKKYFAGDAFANADALILVSDGSESWYLMNDEFTVDGNLAAGENTLTVNHNGLTKTFSVTANKSIQEMNVTTNAETFKNQYNIGDSFDLTGMSVSLKYDDDSEEQLDESNYTVTLLDAEGTSEISMEDFSKTSGQRLLRVSLRGKPDVYKDITLTVFPYITYGEFEFDAIDGETNCVLKSFNPSEPLEGRTISIPETVVQGGIEYKVVQINSGVFNAATDIEAVSIPETVTTIQEGAFEGCTKLSRVYMIYHETLAGFTCEANAFESVAGGKVYLKPSLVSEKSPIPGYKAVSITEESESMELTPPEKLEYILHEQLDTAGMKVTAVLKDGSRVETTNYTMEGYDPSVTGEQTVTVKINGTELHETFKVNVSFPTPAIVISPQDAAYVPGDEIIPITAEAVAQDSHVLYQWYRSETADGTGSPIEGATGMVYTPTQGGYYYAGAYVEDKNGKRSSETYTERANISVADYVAITGTKGFMSLKEAVEAAEDEAVVRLCKDVIATETITISGKSIVLDGGGHMINRCAKQGDKVSFIGAFLNLAAAGLNQKEAKLTVQNITLDGGFKWYETNIDPILGRDAAGTGPLPNQALITVNAGSSLQISGGTVLQNNVASAWGAAVYAKGAGASISIDGGVIRNNATSGIGSAICIQDSASLSVISGVIESNCDASPGNNQNGTAIALTKGTTATVSGGIFRRNKGGNNLTNSRGGVFHVNQAKLTITGGLFENNGACAGGAVYYESGSTGQISGAVFRGNKAYIGTDSTGGNGGAIYSAISPTLSGCTFENNTAAQNGGAVWVSGNLTLSSGTSFTGNEAVNGDGVYMKGTLTINKPGKVQEIYCSPFKTIELQSDVNDLNITTDTAIDASTVIARMGMRYAATGTINGMRLYVVNDNGWKVKAENNEAQFQAANWGIEQGSGYSSAGNKLFYGTGDNRPTFYGYKAAFSTVHGTVKGADIYDKDGKKRASYPIDTTINADGEIVFYLITDNDASGAKVKLTIE